MGVELPFHHFYFFILYQNYASVKVFNLVIELMFKFPNSFSSLFSLYLIIDHKYLVIFVFCISVFHLLIGSLKLLVFLSSVIMIIFLFIVQGVFQHYSFFL